MEGFMGFLIDAALLFALVLIVEQIKKFQKDETVEKWKDKKIYLIIFIVGCIPLALISSLKDGVFDENTKLAIVGITIRTFILMAAFGTFFYDAILKKALKQKEDLDE